ncbi:DUF4276 family protein [Rhizobium laguerreae]|nr:DUF4276 family protein [Rhizobium laguerreae]
MKTCLTPHLIPFHVHAFPVILQAPSGRHRGGRVTVERLAKFMSHQYDECDYITTFVDFYGFQEAGERTRAELEHDILAATLARRNCLNPQRILPYLQMHEFEALLFSDTSKFEWVLDGWNDDVRLQLQQVRQQFVTPENINNSRVTAPSKRILSIFPEGTYSKVVHGPIIAEQIGIEAIRNDCPAFHAWLQLLEGCGAV